MAMNVTNPAANTRLVKWIMFSFLLRSSELLIYPDGLFFFLKAAIRRVVVCFSRRWWVSTSVIMQFLLCLGYVIVILWTSPLVTLHNFAVFVADAPEKFFGQSALKIPNNRGSYTGNESPRRYQSVSALMKFWESRVVCAYMFRGAGEWADAATVTNACNTRKTTDTTKHNFQKHPPRIESLFLRLFAETLQTCCLRGFSFLSLHHLAAHLTEPVLPVRDHLKVTVTLLAWAPTDKHLSRLFSQITDESFPLSATSRSTEWHLEIASCFRKS